jgi:TDG/mug DNA glycosylase family protein
VPLALADLHRALQPDAPVDFVVFEGDAEHDPWPDDAFAGRLFSRWPAQLLRDVVEGAGFIVEGWARHDTRRGAAELHLQLRRARTLSDSVGAGMRLLVVGLNPSLYSADVGAPFARPGNRFWPAAITAGLASRPRDPGHALANHGVGMTDLVKRATRAAKELDAEEYRAGLARLERLVTWLQPRALCIVGLEGWRTIHRGAAPGVQPDPLGGRPVYLMPNTSGLNARTQMDGFVHHLRAAAALAD